MIRSFVYPILTVLWLGSELCNAIGQQPLPKKSDFVTMTAPDVANVSLRMERFFLNKHVKGNRGNWKILTATPPFEIASFNGWSFRRVRYIPPIPSNQPASLPLLSAIVALRGSNEEFVLQAAGDHSDFGEFLHYNKFIVRTAEDANVIMDVFRRLFDAAGGSISRTSNNKFVIALDDEAGRNRQRIVSIETDSAGVVRAFRCERP